MPHRVKKKHLLFLSSDEFVSFAACIWFGFLQASQLHSASKCDNQISVSAFSTSPFSPVILHEMCFCRSYLSKGTLSLYGWNENQFIILYASKTSHRYILHVFQTATLVDGATTKMQLSTAAFTDSIKMVSSALRMHCNVSISIC